MKIKKEILPGEKCGRVTIIKLDKVEEQNYFRKDRQIFEKRYRYFYLCKCDCGNECVIEKKNLLKNKYGCQQCGHNHHDIIVSTHNLTKTRLYKIWQGVKNRCKHHKNYGARGIIVCEEWKNNFMNFYNWAINNGYNDNLTIDRINVNGNYEPSNCRWTDIKTQNRNRRSNRLITYNNETHCITEWAEKLNIKRTLLYDRLCRKNRAIWDIKKALTIK